MVETRYLGRARREPVTTSGRRLMLVLLAVFGLSGCREPASPIDDLAYRDPEVEFLDLPGLRSAPMRELQDELARLVDERATPAMIVQMNVPARDNLARNVVEIFRKSRYDIGSLFRECEATMPPGVFRLDTAWTHDAERLVSMLELPRLKLRERLDDPATRFESPPTSDWAVDSALLQTLWIYSRLEAFECARQMQRGDLDRAVECVAYVLRLAALVSNDRHPAARLEAAYMRTEALKMAQAIVQHRRFQRDHLERMHRHLDEQLDRWPHDAAASIGQRAIGLWVYEMARQRRLGEVLTPEEQEELDAFLGDFSEAVIPRMNDDQLFYLRAMRRIIESCSRPYHARRGVFEGIRGELARSARDDYPVIAGHVLLPDLESGHKIQARDRANVEAWVLACEQGLGLPPRRLIEINPLTGEPYRVERLSDPVGAWPAMIKVTGIGTGPQDGDDPPVVVPDYSERVFEDAP